MIGSSHSTFVRSSLLSGHLSRVDRPASVAHLARLNDSAALCGLPPVYDGIVAFLKTKQLTAPSRPFLWIAEDESSICFLSGDLTSPGSTENQDFDSLDRHF